MAKTVVVGMSGGVDSSVAAYLLKEQGYDVIGVTMQIWQDDRESETDSCCGISAVGDAKRVAAKIGIPHYVMNFREEFKEKVIDYFNREYLSGRTPNPCNACNRYIKWEALLNRARQIGADYVATGHYARILQLDNGRYAVAASVTDTKDQSYALYNLTQEQLAHTLMPCGAYTKPQIRQIASDIGLLVADKPDSQEICFIPDDDHAAYIEKATGIKVPEGNFVDKYGNVLGRHKGITHYTIGQRRGLGLAMGHHVFVSEIRPGTNEVVIGENEDIFSTSLIAEDVNLMGAEHLDGIHCIGKIRYAHKGAPCYVTELPDGRIRVDFETPQRAITPGQAVVLYGDGYVLGGGTILGKAIQSF